jgi:hypothetical protein
VQNICPPPFFVVVFFGNLPEAPPRDAKSLPTEIETRYFRQARITGYRLKKAG